MDSSAARGTPARQRQRCWSERASAPRPSVRRLAALLARSGPSRSSLGVKLAAGQVKEYIFQCHVLGAQRTNTPMLCRQTPEETGRFGLDLSSFHLYHSTLRQII